MQRLLIVQATSSQVGFGFSFHFVSFPSYLFFLLLLLLPLGFVAHVITTVLLLLFHQQKEERGKRGKEGGGEKKRRKKKREREKKKRALGSVAIFALHQSTERCQAQGRVACAWPSLLNVMCVRVCIFCVYTHTYVHIYAHIFPYIAVFGSRLRCLAHLFCFACIMYVQPASSRPKQAQARGPEQ